LEISQKLKEEGKYLAILFISLVILLKIVMYNSYFFSIIKIVFAIFWLFILPGFCLLYYWHEKLSFLERLIFGFSLGAAIIGVLGYNIALIGISNNIHHIIFPIASFVLAFFIIRRAPG